MGKKSKHIQPNAPELQQVLLDSHFTQPPHNPYYPDLSNHSHINQLPPPPYPDLSTNSRSNSFGMVRTNAPSTVRNQDLPRQAPSTIVVQQPVTIAHNYAEEAHARKVRRFNNELFILGFITLILACIANHLFIKRRCPNYIVHQPTREVSFHINDVRDAQLMIAAFSVVPILVSLVRCAQGNTKSHSGYLTLVAIISFCGALFTGYVSYLAFYSSCPVKVGEIANSLARTFFNDVANIQLPNEGVFAKSNVIETINGDPNGIIILIIDALISLSFFCEFFESIGHL